ncbi:hypothetical protein CDES_00920 [Corynebacterium deserti GIMN1.010]|uniref:Secreted protein n=1 Tax=Corynebacterium deserti GIMN1.010 TaxID=931089 RepID=A0A0M4CHG6_9CORY|nr:hypothetical protein [Corynebacterium deserti]ALC04664.1 hypothetical protein CDES_00920 [Corynebacterium deserti GIMN1.010]
MKNHRLLATFGAMVAVSGLAVPLATQASAAQLSEEIPDRTQITLINSDGSVEETDNADESRPALSLAKLYLGYYVLGNGSDEDGELVPEMIQFSDDYTADYLESQYPEALPEVIEAFDLEDTEWGGFWGNATTSTTDVARFVAEILDDPVAAPMIDAMTDTADYAADGYAQDFGTYTLSDVEGTKFGWSDNLDVHSSVSFGPGFVIAANTYGDAETLTDDVQDAVYSLYPELATDLTQYGAEEEQATTALTPIIEQVCTEIRSGMHTAAELKEQLKGTTVGQTLAILPNSAPIPAFVYNLLAS